MSMASQIPEEDFKNSLSDDSEKVLSALNNKDFVWRTVDGVVKETKLSEPIVLTVLNSLPADILVRTTGRQGQLYTTRDHYYSSQSFLGRFLTAATGQFK
jgi:hypothetical protein